MLIRSLLPGLPMGLLLFAPSLLLASPASGNPDTSNFRITQKTQVPGRTLKAGTYTIQIVDHLHDRMILRVDGPGTEETTFLGLPGTSLPKPAASGPITLGDGSSGKAAFRGFAFPNGTVAQFVYPKKEAVSLAKTFNIEVPAVDPVSDGLAATSNLSASDMQIVTLWTLSPTPVGPGGGKPGISAKRYEPPTNQVASGTPPASPTPRRPAIAALPHTASDTPLLWLTALLSLAGASLLSGRRILDRLSSPEKPSLTC